MDGITLVNTYNNDSITLTNYTVTNRNCNESLVLMNPLIVVNRFYNATYFLAKNNGTSISNIISKFFIFTLLQKKLFLHYKDLVCRLLIQYIFLRIYVDVRNHYSFVKFKRITREF